MSLLDKLLGKKQSAHPAGTAQPERSDLPPTIKFWDSYGRIVEIPREEWRKLLPGNFKQHWNAPDDLAMRP